MLHLKKEQETTVSDLELVTRYKQTGELHHVGLLYQRYTHLILGICLKYLKNEEDSKDAAMEIFENLTEVLLKHEITNFKSWLHTTTRNHCLRNKIMLVAFENVKAADEQKISCLTFEQMMHYVEKTLSPAQRAAVDTHLTQCELCSEALEGFAAFPDKARLPLMVEDLHAEIQTRYIPETVPAYQPSWSERLAEAAQSAKNWFAEAMETTVSILTTPRQNLKLAYAMATVFLAGVASVFYLNRETPGEKLFAAYYQPYPNIASSVRGETSADKLQDALQQYDAQNFKAALASLQEILRTEPGNTTAHFYAGICYLKLEEAAHVRPHFSKVIEANDERLAGPAAWYLALAYLQQNDLPQARTTLAGIGASGQVYQEQARQLLSNCGSSEDFRKSLL